MNSTRDYKTIKTIETKDSNNVRTNLSPEIKVNSATVVIVGAGVSGLAAAQRLYELGIRDIIILDALDRIGGRIFTVDHSDYLIELGAQWLHGAEENPIFDWLNKLELLDDFEDGELGMAGLFCNNFGQKISQKLVKKFLNVMCEIKANLSNNNYSDMIKANKFKNAGQVFRHQLELEMIKSDSFLSTFDDDNSIEELETLVFSLFDWFMRFESIENCCDSMDDVSITSYTDWTDFSDGALLNFKHGYRSLLQWFCKQMPTEELIYLNKQVVSIELLNLEKSNNKPTSSWLNESDDKYSKPILIRYKKSDLCASISENTKKDDETNFIICDHVIVTSSLGFLRNNLKTFFKPPLPKIKQDLIKSIGFGTVNKIILQFKRPFWNDEHGIKLVWSENKQTIQNDDGEFPVWVKDIISFDSVRRQPNLLIGWIGGHGAKLMELESDSKVGEVCLKLFDKFLPKEYEQLELASNLIGCVCSRWYSNPFTKGSYSFQSMASFRQNVDKLHEPVYGETSDNKEYNTSGSKRMKVKRRSSVEKKVLPRILFAGEATAGKLYSTAHGAIISGWREAERLRDCILES